MFVADRQFIGFFEIKIENQRVSSCPVRAAFVCHQWMHTVSARTPQERWDRSSLQKGGRRAFGKLYFIVNPQASFL